MGFTKFLLRTCCVFVLLSVFGCSKGDDDPGDPADPDNFYSGAITNAGSADLLGYWAITQAEYEGVRVPIPINYTNCGPDFFAYRENGAYQEYLYSNSACETNRNELQWELDKGVITLSTLSGSSDELVIIKLTATELQFKARVDFQEDGTLEVVVLIAKRHTPNEVDFFTETFRQDQAAADDNLIRFTWQAYDGLNTFQKYEVYRSSGDNCSKANAELVATITDVNEASFTDLTPPASERLCYFFKIYTDKGLLGESYLADIPTYTIRTDPVNFNQPTVGANTIGFSWAASDSPYFSHYEIVLSNETPENSAFFDQEQVVAIINDRDITTFTDTNPPYIENPYYAIRVYNIFGNSSSIYSQEATTFWEVPFKRNEILPFFEVFSLTPDPAEPVVYFYGRYFEGGAAQISIQRYNYNTRQTESVSNFNPSVSTSIPIRLVETPNGKEVVLAQGSELYLYNAATLSYKYALNPEGVSSFFEYAYLPDNDIWVVVSNDQIFTLKRDNANLFLVDSAPHYVENLSSSNYKIFGLKNNKVLLGNSSAATSFVYTLDVDGNFVDSQSVNLQFPGGFNNERFLYSGAGDILVDTDLNRVYSSTSFQFLDSFESPQFPSGISLDASRFLGTNNDPDWQITTESLHKKEAIIYNRNTSATVTATTVGYPHILFENGSGEIISVSSGFKKEDLSRNINNKADIFVEKVQVP